MLEEITNKSEFVVALSQNSKGGIAQIPIDTLNIECITGALFFKDENHLTAKGYNYFQEICVDPTRLVWSCFYNGSYDILTCTCGFKECAGFDDLYSYCFNGYIYWLIDTGTDDVFVFRFELDAYRKRVKELIIELRDYYKAGNKMIRESGHEIDWYPSLSQLNELCKMFDEKTDLYDLLRKDEHEIWKVYDRYGSIYLFHGIFKKMINASFVKETPESSPCLTLMVGIPASGKSSYCKEYQWNTEVVSLDLLKSRSNEQFLLDDLFWQGVNITIDNTNVTREERAKYIAQAKQYGYRVEGNFFQSVLADCIERNKQRDGKARVPDKAIVAKSNQLELPSYSEGFDELYFVKIEDDYFKRFYWKEEK